MNHMRKCIILFIFLLGISNSTLLANECENRLFTLNIESTPNHKITLKDVVSDLASSCHITILYADKLTKKELNKELDMLYINDLNLNELFQLLFNEHNLFYTYDASLSRLKLSYIQTKSFNIDYINVAQMQTSSTRDITVGATALGDTAAGTGTTGTTGTTGGTGATVGGTNGATGGGNSDTTSVTASSEFTFWDELKEQIDGMLQRDGDTNEVKSWSMLNRDAGLVTVSGSFNQLTRVEKYITDLEKRMHKQVLLEVRILEVTYSDGKNVGIDWSKFDLSLSGRAKALETRQNGPNISEHIFGSGFDFTMTGLINFLNTYGKVEVLSSPKVMTLNNQPALINVGDQLNYKYESGQVDTAGLTTPTATTTFSMGSVFIGLSLSIIPEITEDGHVILRINPVDSRILNENDTTLSTTTTTSSTVRSIAPDVKLKQMTSIVKAKDGSKVLIGGLTQSESFNDDNKVPLLGDIPYLGRLFHSTSTRKTKKEFFIVITPMIIKENRMPTIEEEEIIQRTQNHIAPSRPSDKEES